MLRTCMYVHTRLQPHNSPLLVLSSTKSRGCVASTRFTTFRPICSADRCDCAAYTISKMFVRLQAGSVFEQQGLLLKPITLSLISKHIA